ncbi:hypothetical protein N9Y42_03430 [Mariniblastus sp.]|nr:hypothetical protein [Mariniblastus sp.]
MIKQITGVELSSCKTRSGLTSVSELLPRLIRSYELQAELMQRRSEQAAETKTKHCPAPMPPSSDLLTQATFTWF